MTASRSAQSFPMRLPEWMQFQYEMSSKANAFSTVADVHNHALRESCVAGAVSAVCSARSAGGNQCDGHSADAENGVEGKNPVCVAGKLPDDWTLRSHGRFMHW